MSATAAGWFTPRQWPIRCAEALSHLDTAYAPQPGRLPPTCCTSCHEDEGDGYALCGATLYDGTQAQVCCVTVALLERAGLVTR